MDEECIRNALNQIHTHLSRYSHLISELEISQEPNFGDLAEAESFILGEIRELESYLESKLRINPRTRGEIQALNTTYQRLLSNKSRIQANYENRKKLLLTDFTESDVQINIFGDDHNDRQKHWTDAIDGLIDQGSAIVQNLKQQRFSLSRTIAGISRSDWTLSRSKDLVFSLTDRVRADWLILSIGCGCIILVILLIYIFLL